MASSEKKITVVIGGEATGAKTAMAETESAGSKLGGTLLKLGAAVGGVFAVKEGVDFLKDSMKAAAEEQQNMAVLNHTLDENLHTTDKQKAANEKWITSLQNATGVSRDELEPALGKLVIAGEDLTLAHKNMAIATDIAAARHIDLATVVQGIAKAAATGHTTALGRMGLATKDAAGHALTLQQVLENAAKTMGGSAAAAADTVAGKSKIMGEKFHDVKVQIGEALLPVMGWLTDKLSELTSWLSDHLPAAIDWTKEKAKQLGDWFDQHVLPTLTKVANWIKDTLVPDLELFAQWVVTHQPVLIGVLSALGVGFAVWAVNAGLAAAATVLAMAPVILLAAAIGALTAGIVWAYQNWGWFRDAVDTVASFLKNDLIPIIQNVAGWLNDHLVPIIRDVLIFYVKAFKEEWKVAWTVVSDYVVIAWDVIRPIIDAMKSALDKVTGPLKTVAGWAGNVGGAVGGFFGHFADGGIVPGAVGMPGLAVVHGGEMILNPGQQARAFAGGGGGGGMTVNVIFSGVVGDPAEAGRQVVDVVRQYEQRNGTGWRN